VIMALLDELEAQVLDVSEQGADATALALANEAAFLMFAGATHCNDVHVCVPACDTRRDSARSARCRTCCAVSTCLCCCTLPARDLIHTRRSGSIQATAACAGTDNSTFLMCKLVVALHNHPEWFKRLQAEQVALQQEHGDAIDRHVGSHILQLHIAPASANLMTSRDRDRACGR
jgi:hypothetical protein